jgi:hypothetical protein
VCSEKNLKEPKLDNQNFLVESWREIHRYRHLLFQARLAYIEEQKKPYRSLLTRMMRLLSANIL